MATQKIIWTVLPKGFTLDGELVVSLLPSFRLTPQAADEQLLKAFPALLAWPATLDATRFGLRVGTKSFALQPITKPDPAAWARAFPADLPVAGYVYNDLSRHNLRSYPARTVVSFLHKHYGELAEHDGLQRPNLFGTGGRLQGLLGEMGIRGRDARQTGITRWFSDGRSKEGGKTWLETSLNESYFSDHGYAPPVVTGIDGQSQPNTSSYLSGRHVRRALPANLSGPATALFSGEPEYGLYQANRFYARPENDRAYSQLPVAGATSARVQAPEFDFHRLASSFSDAPALMRQLGLVIDAVVLKGSALLDQADAQPQQLLRGTMRLDIRRRGALRPTTEESLPRTAFWLTRKRFTCDTRTPRHRAGLLRLSGAAPIGKQLTDPKTGDRGFALTALDPDGAALKTIGFALTMQDHLAKVANPFDADTLSKAGELSYTTSASESVAALRSGGITLIEHGRAGNVADDTIASSLKNEAVEQSQGNKIVFFAEDVLRGYRLDVFTEKALSWQSLCRRVAEYDWIDGAGPALAPAKDEGYLSGASTTTKPPDELPPDAVQDHYLHEALAKWTGWSLVVPRPGRRIRPYPDSTTPQAERDKLGLIQEEVVDEQSAADTHPDGSPVTRQVDVAPGSLPKLRFGEAYRLRARLVDLAGNSLAFDDAGIAQFEEASEPIEYLRYEPLEPPALALRTRVSEGESLERMVIRSNHALSSADYLGNPPYAGNVPTDSGFVYGAQNERHFVPPKTSQLAAEQHGMLDAAFGPAATPQSIADAFETVAAREAGTLYDGGASVHIVTPRKEGATPPSPERDLAVKPPEGFRLLPGEYLVHTEPALATPYLPDPLAAAVALRGVPGVTAQGVIDAEDHVFSVQLPGTNDFIVYVPLAGDWPEAQGFRLAIVEHPDEAPFDNCSPGAQLPDRMPTWVGGDERVLTVYLRKGEIANVRYASAVKAAFLHHMAIPRLAATPFKVALQSVMGAHWMVTPDRPLVLVHATQQPVCEPVFERMNIFRATGQTWAEIRRTQVRYHARSTAKLEVMAQWMEWIDDPALPAPVRRRFTAQLPEVGVPAPALHSQEPASGVSFESLGAGGADAATAHLRHEFGDHRFRLVRYRLRATTRFGEYLPPAITDDPDATVRIGPDYAGHSLSLPPGYEDQRPDSAVTPMPPLSDAELGAPLLPGPPQLLAGCIVPGSRRPAAPKVPYAVPTMRWDTPPGTSAVHAVIRRGNGLRIFLERPWFSSGEGELLGVVVGSNVPSEQPFATLPDSLIGYVSQWGQDPILASVLPRNVMRANAFGARVATYEFTLPEAGQSMVVAAHRVHYDFQRRLWFADLEIDAGASYNPFVRLALVRVQPHSVSGCALSEVVHTQYAQLLPRRELQLRLGRGSVTLQVFGPAPEIGPASGRGEFTGRLDLPTGMADAFGPLLGYDRGRNRIEMVVQEQRSTLDTDLDWEDVASIPPLTGDALPGQTPPLAAKPTLVSADPGVAPLRASIGIGDFAERFSPDVLSAAVLDLHRLRSDMLFSGSLKLPTTPAGARRRLMVREFERHFGDFQVTDSTPIGQVKRPGIAERLVFAREFYVLGYVPAPESTPEQPTT